MFAFICYFIWFFRNKAIFEGVNTDSFSIISSATHTLADFWEANKWPERAHPLLLSKSWASPPSSRFHVFFDGAISNTNLGVGYGVFVADHDGSFVYGVSKSFAGIRDPHLVELLALREALLTAQLLGVSQSLSLGMPNLLFLRP